MRKTRITLIAVALLLAAGLTCGFVSLHNSDKVTTTWTTVYGDTSEAEGLEITGSAGGENFNTYLWKVNYSVADAAVTMTSEPVNEKRTYATRYGTFELYLNNHISGTIVSPTYTSAAQICYDRFQAAKAENSEITSIKVPMADIFEYYPLDGWIYFGYKSFHMYDVGDVIDIESGVYANYLKLYNDLLDFFKFPVADAYLNISDSSITFRDVWTDSEKQEVPVFNNVAINGGLPVTYMQSLITADNIYIYFYNNDVDCSLIPGGYGIYRLPYDPGTEDEIPEFFSEDLANIFPMAAGTELKAVTYNEEDDSLFIYTTENNLSYVTIIDPESGEVRQKIAIDNPDVTDHYSYGKNYFVLRSYEGAALVYEKGEDGVYTKKIDVTLDDATLASFDDELIWGYGYDVDYKDGKLAILLRAPEQWYDEFDEQYFTYASNVKAALVILDSEGLAYVATLDNSLCQASFGHHVRYDLIKPGTDGACYSETNPVSTYSISWN